MDIEYWAPAAPLKVIVPGAGRAAAVESKAARLKMVRYCILNIFLRCWSCRLQVKMYLV